MNPYESPQQPDLPSSQRRCPLFVSRLNRFLDRCAGPVCVGWGISFFLIFLFHMAVCWVFKLFGFPFSEDSLAYTLAVVFYYCCFGGTALGVACWILIALLSWIYGD